MKLRRLGVLGLLLAGLPCIAAVRYTFAFATGGTFRYTATSPTEPGASLSEHFPAWGNQRKLTGEWSFFTSGSPTYSQTYTAKTDTQFPNVPGFYPGVPAEFFGIVLFTNTRLATTVDITIEAVTLPVVNSAALVSSGVNQTLTARFSHPDGYAGLDVVNALINDTLSGTNACYVAYSQPLRVLYLVNDLSWSGLSTGLRLGERAGEVSNSQCTIFSSGSSATGRGDTLELVLNVAFKSSFRGSKIVYLSAMTLNEVSSRWKPASVAMIPEPVAYPQPGLMSPVAGHASSHLFSFSFQDATNANNIQTAWALFNTSIDGRDACYVAYSLPANRLYLYPDNGDGAQAPSIALTGNSVIENGQCRITAAGSSATIRGHELVLNLNITFKDRFNGTRVVWGAVQTLGTGEASAWKAIGAWQVSPL